MSCSASPCDRADGRRTSPRTPLAGVGAGGGARWATGRGAQLAVTPCVPHSRAAVRVANAVLRCSQRRGRSRGAGDAHARGHDHDAAAMLLNGSGERSLHQPSAPFGPVSRSRSMSASVTASSGVTGRNDWALATRPSSRRSVRRWRQRCDGSRVLADVPGDGEVFDTEVGEFG